MSIKRVKLRAAIAEYLAADAVYLGYAETTKRSYRRSLDILSRVVPSQAMAYELGAQWIDMALSNLRDGGLAPENPARARIGWTPRGTRGAAALANDVKAFKSFVRFLWRYEYLGYSRNPCGHLKSNPTNRAAQAPIEKMVIQPDVDVFDKLLDAAGKRHPRDRMLVALGIHVGLRESELKSLRISGLDFDKTIAVGGVEERAPEVRVFRQKQQAWHRVPMSADMEAEARKYLAWYEETHGPLQPEWFVLATRRSGLEKLTRDGRFHPGTGRLTIDTPLDPTQAPDSLTKDIRIAIEAAGYGKLYRTGAHTLRRMAAIYIDKATGDKDAAQFLLGHEVRQTTESYLQWADRQGRLRESMRKLPSRAAVPKIAEIHSDVSANVIQFPSRQNVA